MMIRQALCGLFTLFTLFPLQTPAKPLSISVNAESAILMNAETGAILYEKNPRTLQYPASITKIATAAYALKLKGNQLDTLVEAEQESIASVTEAAIRRSNYTLPAYWVEQGSSHMGIKKGEQLTFRALLYGMMLPSANDSANVVAQFSGGTIPKFIEQLNAYLKEIGCQNTQFLNPHGLHHPKHQTTAYDMALITREALKHPAFCEVVATVRYTRPKTNKQDPTTLVQLNKLLRSGRFYYPKAIGVKTGHTSQALNTFVAAAKHNDRTLIAVLLKTKERNDIFTDATKMFETAFNEAKVQRVLLKEGQQKFALELEGAGKPVPTYLKENLAIEYYPSEEPQVKCLLYWDTLLPPIAKDQRVGELSLVTTQGQVLRTVPLFAAEDISTTWIYWFKHLFS